MIKILKETFDNELTRQQRKKAGNRNAMLTSDEKNVCQLAAKKAVCQTGISMYGFTKIFKSHYHRAVENEALHQAIDIGIENGLLDWGEPRRIDLNDTGAELRNIILSEKCFATLSQPGTDLILATMHSAYSEKKGDRRFARY